MTDPEVLALVVRCPHCGGVVLWHSSCKSTEDPYLLTKDTYRGASGAAVSTYVSKYGRTETRELPTRASRTAKATLWQRAVAIAHDVLDEQPEAAASDQEEAFKVRCAEQQLPYGERAAGRPLYARAMEYVREQRKRRAAR